MAVPRSEFQQWREESSAALKGVLPQGYFPMFQAMEDYTIEIRMFLHPAPGPFGSTFDNPQTVGLIQYSSISYEWWGTTTGPNKGWVLYPDLASAAISICTAHRLKGN